MRHEDHRELLRRRTAQTAARHRRQAWKLAARRGEPLEPGDLVLAEATEHLPVEWLVLEKAGTDPVRLLVAPVDTMALLGAADMRLARAETGGPVVARCAHAVWVRADRLSPRLRSGRVDAGQLADARERRARLPAEDSDPHPDYEDWLADVVLPARDRLQAEEAATAPHRHLYRIAAAVLLAVGLALAALWLTDRRGERVEDAAGVPVAFLAVQGSLRGEATTLELPGDARRFVLVVFLDPARLFDRYRVELVSGAGGEPEWTSGEVPRRGAAHLGLELRREAVPDGEHVVRLYGLAGDPVLAGEFPIEIVSR